MAATASSSFSSDLLSRFIVKSLVYGAEEMATITDRLSVDVRMRWRSAGKRGSGRNFDIARCNSQPGDISPSLGLCKAKTRVREAYSVNRRQCSAVIVLTAYP